MSNALVFLIKSSTYTSRCNLSIIAPPIIAIINHRITYTRVSYIQKYSLKSTKLPKSTIGVEIKNENVTPSGNPALVYPINKGINEH